MREHPVAGKAVLCNLGLRGFLDRRWEATAERAEEAEEHK